MKPKVGNTVFYYIGEGKAQRVYVALVLEVFDETKGECWLRIFDKGVKIPPNDHNRTVFYSPKPESGFWSFKEV